MNSLRIEPLDRRHAVEAFDCGRTPLNVYLQRHALNNQTAGAGRTYVALSGDEVVGYYTLAVGQVEHGAAPERLAKGLPRHPIPVLLLARLGVARAWQNRGIGAGLLQDVMRRAVAVADIAGIRAVTVHAKDEAARSFYERLNFAASDDDPSHLYLLMKQVRSSVARTTPAP